jgi:hypothetical protein
LAQGKKKEASMTEKIEKQKISFRYKVSPNFAAYAIDGVHGGLTPNGEIMMNVFHERPAIPQKTVHEINPDGTLGETIEKEGKKSIIRDVPFGLSMSPSTARIIAKWLNEKADEYDKFLRHHIENKVPKS